MVTADMVIAAVPQLIPPSSPTPPHLRHLPLSFLDQLAPPVFIHIILYLPPDSRPTTSDSLKTSFADVLSLHYPLAGRLRDNSWIDCNDAGAEYIEAHFPHHNMADIIKNPLPTDLQHYVPPAPSGGADIPLAVQVSFFNSSGVAIGVCMSHRVADATSMAAFVTAWAAAAACRTAAAVHPSFGLTTRFPQADFSQYIQQAGLYSPEPKTVVTKTFIFDKNKLSILKKASSGPSLVNPTNVEAISAFIWHHLIAAKPRTTSFAATHAVDIRRRASPPLPELFFGNACARAMAMTESRTDNYYDLAVKLREAISKVDSSYVGRLENGEEFLKYYSISEENEAAFREGKKVLEVCGFTSWWRLPVYEADFGWGKPEWVSIVAVPVRNQVFFLGTKSGDGIEAWVNMEEEDIAAIERSYSVLGQEVETNV